MSWRFFAVAVVAALLSVSSASAALDQAQVPAFRPLTLSPSATSAAPATALGACANEEFRTGPSAQLPDCRAYELVSPRDSNGRKLSDPSPYDLYFDNFPVELVSPSRHSFMFQTWESAFKTPTGGASREVGDIWLAERKSSGWEVGRPINPSALEALSIYPGGISSDHQYSFVFVPLQLKGLPENGTLAHDGDADYLGDPTGGFELTGVGSLGVERLAQGRYISPGGEHVLFSTGRKPEESGWCNFVEVQATCAAARLEPEAPPTGTGTIYDRPADGPTHVVSLLPGDVTPSAGQNALYQGTSADGSSVAFKIGATLYIRADNGAAGARTEEVAADPTTFGGISADGTYLFYVSGGNIHRFNTETEEDQEVNSSSDGEMVNVSADGSHVYFVSRSQLDGANGTAGEPNLYVWSGSSPTYIATVAESDIDISGKGVGLTNWTSQAVRPAPNGENPGPGWATSRTTPDGSVIVFESEAQVTPPYDNAGHNEVYRYDAVDEILQCVSCNPSGAPAAVDARLQNSILVPTSIIHNVTVDGGRVFFETSEALVDEDLDIVNDVYEWQEADAGPIVALISSGNSALYPHPEGKHTGPNVLLGVSPDGGDVFFRSLDPLLPGAPEGGAPAIYDARVGGGFPLPTHAQPCLGSAVCRPGATYEPPLREAGSAAQGKSGNVKSRHRCRGRKSHAKRLRNQRLCHKKSHKKRKGGAK